MIPPEMLKVSLPGGRNQPQEGMPMGVEQMDFMEGVTVVKVGGGGGQMDITERVTIKVG